MPVDIALGVNIDHVATLRQSRFTPYPDPVKAAHIARDAGADVITFHLREDRRHIQDADVRMLITSLSCRTNLEMAVTDEMIGIAIENGPDNCCLVPERREELTTEGGLDVSGAVPAVKQAVTRLTDAGIRVSLFIDPDLEQIDAATECGAPVIELHTGSYAEQSGEGKVHELQRIRAAAEYAHARGLVVNAGHGLNYDDVSPVAAIREIVELNIGHSIIARAIFAGLENAVREMITLMQDARK